MKRLFVLFFSALLLVSCSNQENTPDPTGSAPLVVVSIPPYKQFVSKIAGDTVTVMSAVPEQYDPHIFEITPGRLNELSSANLWIGVHEHFEQKIIPILQRDNKAFKYLDLTTRVPLLRFSEDTTQLIPQHDHHHGDHHHNDQGCCSKEGYDRHIWMSPKLSLLQAKIIKEALSNLLPEFAKLYEKNYQAFLAELTNLNSELLRALEPVRGRSLVVNHASLGYFCHDFGLHQLALETEGKSLLPHELKSIEQVIRHDQISCIYVMPQFGDKSSGEIAKQLNLNIVHIDPLEEDYIDNMRYITSMILGCKLNENASPD